MYVAVNANIRVAQGAKHSLNKSLQISFRGGAVTGPSIHDLIKLFSTITLVLATIFVNYGLIR
ncbi:sodium/proton-translocating pyrophosphatase [Clostridium uliginosum]|uniref:sodium/proton-translocating pyrophosphatase n=1 Tax=Clostridium uliginosum TaxID=119641 RepID=UPI000B7C8956|nr:sodium/proton-translocating pyrophosphatase [Clostridium uliginosum]